jgi:hypothetical protein
MTRIRNRAALAAVPLALCVLAIGAASASASSTQWGDNGSGTCSAWQSILDPSQDGTELGTYCMQSVTGWISIGGGASQQQAISCSNNAPGGSPGLSWSLDGQGYVNNPQWYEVALQGTTTGGQGSEEYPFVGWQTGDSGMDLSSESWLGLGSAGNASTGNYGSWGAGVTNWGGSGQWQAALACINAGGGQLVQTSRVRSGIGSAAVPVRIADKKIDTIDKAKGRAFLAREYALKKNVTRTDTRSCPAGMVRRADLAYTVQEFPADNKAPKWKNRSLVSVKMTPKGKNAGSVKMTLKRAKNPTVVQFQLRCGKR